MYKIQTWTDVEGVAKPKTGYLTSYYDVKDASVEFYDYMNRQQSLKKPTDGKEFITIDGVKL